MVNAGWLGFMRSEIVSDMKLIIFQGCPTKQVALLPGLPAPYNALPNSATFVSSRMV